MKDATCCSNAPQVRRERDEEPLRKFLAAARTAEPRVDPNEELLRELLEALRTLRARTARPGDSAVAEDPLGERVRELGDRALAAHRAADAATAAAFEAFEETARRAGADAAGLREASAKFERAARAASEEVLRRLRSLRPWRPWLAAPIAAAACVLFLGALAQRKFGDGLRRNAYVAERCASRLACCAAKAKPGGEGEAGRRSGRPSSDGHAAGGCRGAVPPRGRPASRESRRGAVAWSRRSLG